MKHVHERTLPAFVCSEDRSLFQQPTLQEVKVFSLKSATLPALLFFLPLRSFAVEATSTQPTKGTNWAGILFIALLFLALIGLFAYLIVTQDDRPAAPRKDN